MSLLPPVHVCLGLALAMLPHAASAIGATEERSPRERSQSVRRLEAGQPALAPFAHVVFCRSNPNECRTAETGPSRIDLDPANTRLLNEVNVAVNRAIRPVNDKKTPLGDVWSLSPSKGDCEDFAVTKRHRLVAKGVPAQALRLVTAITRSGEGHAALVVSTDQGDMLLDNRTNRIVPWTQAGLVYQKVQSASDPRRWFGISGTAVASNEP
ncbi:transglutaminase-like cysteine peptidase [Aureimonas psammosilenae]|uniref:transglutaminase-like cysteine peptidase n=1 Tax=Aureimonas psammosilenae TaxID=2495496 RepID=UPI00126071D0|nr:transglutaminase-like cysteine peptidase [Aureimonas psammosilenae]